jgi:hypothetical protein
VALLFYVDDGIFLAPKQAGINEAYAALTKPVVAKTGEVMHCAFVMMDKDNLSNYLGVKIDHLKN